ADGFARSSRELLLEYFPISFTANCMDSFGGKRSPWDKASGGRLRSFGQYPAVGTRGGCGMTNRSRESLSADGHRRCRSWAEIARQAIRGAGALAGLSLWAEREAGHPHRAREATRAVALPRGIPIGSLTMLLVGLLLPSPVKAQYHPTLP